MAWLLLPAGSCNNRDTTSTDSYQKDAQTKPKVVIKPLSTYPDTLIISKPAAVFYHPDSIQLAKIKAQTDSSVFDGSMHEFFYQMRNARMLIKKTWPGLSIVDSKNYQIILFVKIDGSREYCNLDTKNDAYGLFVFNGKESPLLIDMTNIETEISFYLRD